MHPLKLHLAASLARLEKGLRKMLSMSEKFEITHLRPVNLPVASTLSEFALSNLAA